MILKDRYMEEMSNDGGEGGSEPAPATNGSALSSGGESVNFSESLPEKFQVWTGEGDGKALDLETSGAKLLQSYNELNKRLSTQGAAPDSPEKYEINTEAFGEDFDADQFMQDEGTQSFLKRMHAKGMTNSQVQEVLEYGLKEWAPNLISGNQELTQEQALESLKTDIWATGQEFQANMGAAGRAYQSLPQGMQDKINERLGNDPLFIQVMSMFGKEMSEDQSISENLPSSDTSEAEIQELMLSDEYKNPKNPRHSEVAQKVKSWFERKYPGRATA